MYFSTVFNRNRINDGKTSIIYSFILVYTIYVKSNCRNAISIILRIIKASNRYEAYTSAYARNAQIRIKRI